MGGKKKKEKLKNWTCLGSGIPPLLVLVSSLKKTGREPQAVPRGAVLQRCGRCSWGVEGIRVGPTGETLSFLWPLCWRVTSFYSTGPSSLLSSPQCWNFHCGSVFQPVNTHIFHPSWGSSFGRAFLWRSLELIILYFILLYKQHSVAKEHNHKKKPLWGWWWGGAECGLKARRKLTCSECCRSDRSLLVLPPFPENEVHLTTFLLSFSFCHSSASSLARLWHTRDQGAESSLLLFSLSQTRSLSGVSSVAVRAPGRSPVSPAPREPSAIGVRAKASTAGLLPLWRNVGNNFESVSKLAGWTSYRGPGRGSLGMFGPRLGRERWGIFSYLHVKIKRSSLCDLPGSHASNLGCFPPPSI